jgi:hypothetical protein
MMQQLLTGKLDLCKGNKNVKKSNMENP